MRKNPEPKQRVEVQLPEPLVMEASLFIRRNALTGRLRKVFSKEREND